MPGHATIPHTCLSREPVLTLPRAAAAEPASACSGSVRTNSARLSANASEVAPKQEGGNCPLTGSAAGGGLLFALAFCRTLRHHAG